MEIELSEDCNIEDVYMSIFDEGGEIISYDYAEGEVSTPRNLNQLDTEEFEESPNGTVEAWYPVVDVDIKPVMMSVWANPEEALDMYVKYAAKAGFVVRKSSIKYRKDRSSSNRWFVCNRAGKPKNEMKLDTLEVGGVENGRIQRNSNYTVTDCKARIKLRNKKGTDFWVLYEFEEKHNHPLIEDENKHLSKSNRKLLFEDEVFIQNVSTNNIGATKAYRLRAALNGGYDKVRGTVVDYKNAKRDINLFVGNRDAQMIIDKFRNKVICLPEFSFDFQCDGKELACVFWADETSKCNYREFGDVIAFDATFNTNKYKMVFVPFTGVDNHNRCVTFGAGLLKKEDIPSYSWLLRAFLKAHTKQPIMVLTDQDPALAVAVKENFPESQHRLCMWHIMNKVPIKFDSDKLKNSDLREKFHKLVWNVYLDTEEFEKRWNVLIQEFELEEMKWLKDMYEKRDMWIPAFFKHLPLSCLMKTTSRSESTNAFFRLFSHKSHTLVQFMLCFETAMEKQRHAQRILNDHTSITKPKLLTPLPIEKHAAEVYTRTMFFKVQQEIYKGSWVCSSQPFTVDSDNQVFMVKHSNKQSQSHLQFKVTIDLTEDTISCGCNLYGRAGYLCRHIFCVFKSKYVNRIPDKYITRRWRRDILPRHLTDCRHRYGNKNSESDKQSSEALANLELCLSRLRNHPKDLEEFIESINRLTKEKLDKLPSIDSRKDKEERYQTMLGVTIPAEIEILPPTGIKNKGSGTHTGKRLKNPREKPINKKNRLMRECKYCHVIQDDHDIRTCKIRIADLAAGQEATSRAAKANFS